MWGELEGQSERSGERSLPSLGKVSQAVGTATVKTGKAAGFPGESMVKNPPANAIEMDSIPGPKRSHVPLGD